MDISKLILESHSAAARKGWWENPREIGTILALIHSEVSEALEDWRENKMETYYEGDGKPCGFPSEIADIVIRCFDLAGFLNINLEREIITKLEYNQKRPFRHGGKQA